MKLAFQSLLSAMGKRNIGHEQTRNKIKIHRVRKIKTIDKIAVKVRLLLGIYFWGKRNCTWAHRAHELSFLDSALYLAPEGCTLDYLGGISNAEKVQFSKT